MIKNILEDELIEISQELEEKTHQIPGGLNEEELNETADKLNTLIERKNDLQNYFEKINQYLQNRKLIDHKTD